MCSGGGTPKYVSPDELLVIYLIFPLYSLTNGRFMFAFFECDSTETSVKLFQLMFELPAVCVQ